MKTPLLVSMAVQLGLAAAALAAPSGYYGEEDIPVQQAPLPPAQAPLPMAPPVQQPMYFNGPVYIIPATPAPPPAVAPAPVFTQPQVAPVFTQPQVMTAPRPAAPAPSSPDPSLQHRFGIGARVGAMWINQRLYNADMLMMGGGAQARLRLARFFALEATFDVMSKDYHDGVFQRTSYPLQLAALFYLMPTRSAAHFNVYGLLGGGVMPSRITMDDHTNPRDELSATEVLGQLGVGCELRFWRLSFTADARALGMMRTGDASYFDSFIRPDAGPAGLGLRQPAVPERTNGWLFNLGALLLL